MAYMFTPEQFEQALKDSGLGTQFSAADLALSRKNPDFGMSAIRYKQDYANATTDEMRAVANSGLEALRSSIGGYTGGVDGRGYYLNDVQKPQTDDRYTATVQDLLDKVVNRPEFAYDYSTDPLYSQYAKQYTRQGQLATNNTLAAAAGASGGIPSSYAVGAAATAGNNYAAALTDKIPELYQLAYNKYKDDYSMQLSALGAANTAEQQDYAKYVDALSQYDSDRKFNYTKQLDELNAQTAARNGVISEAELAAKYGDYTALNDLGINTDNNTEDWERRYQLAQIAAEIGDFSGLQKLGINTDNNSADWDKQYTLALLAAEYGDFSGLQKLGITPNADNLKAFSGSGGGSANASGNGYGSTTGAEPADEPTEPITLSPESIENLTMIYGGKELTGDQWNEIIDVYGNLGVSDDVLSAAGFTKAEAGTLDVAKVTDYDSAIACMQGAGVDAGIRAGLMTKNEWARRKASLKATGTGGAEVSNYNSYTDYAKDYVQYAADAGRAK